MKSRGSDSRGLPAALFAAATVWSVAGLVAAADVPLGVEADELLPAMNGQASDFAPRRAGAGVGAECRIEVAQDGLYRVGWTQLTQAGISPAALVGDQLRLFCRTQEVAILTTTSGLFAQSDSFMFFGQRWNGAYSKTNVYWLGFGDGGLRMEQTSASVLGAGPVTSHWQTVLYAPKRLYQAYYRANDGSMDHWFATNINDTGSATVQVITEGREAGGLARLDIVLDGLWDQAGVNPDHNTRVTIGGIVTTSFVHEALNAYTGTVWFPSTRLSDGATTVALRGTNNLSQYDWSLLRWLAIGYTRALRPAAGTVTFDGETGARDYTITGLVAATGFNLLNIDNPFRPAVVTGLTGEAHNGSYRLQFGWDSASPPRFHLTEDAQVLKPPVVRKVTFRNLADSTRVAEWVAVCPYAFRDSAYTLIKHRYKEGLKVAVAPMEDIYNEFGYGIVDAAALKQFIGYAYHHWNMPRVRYVCLMGEGTYDPLDNLGLHAANWIPARMGPSGFMWTSLENWFAMVDGADQLADVAIGRIPVDTSSQLRNVVNKITAFEAATGGLWRTRALLVADNVDGVNNFKQATTNRVKPHLVAGGIYSLSESYLDSSSAGNIRTNIENRINGGRFFVSYFGHGAHNQWADEDVWNNTDVSGLSNSEYPIVAMFTCKSGAMHDPTAECLAEVFVEKSNKGAVSAVVSTDLTVLHWSEIFADGFTEALAEAKEKRIGDALRAGLGALHAASPQANELLTFEIVGDPGLVVNP